MLGTSEQGLDYLTEAHVVFLKKLFSFDGFNIPPCIYNVKYI